LRYKEVSNELNTMSIKVVKKKRFQIEKIEEIF